MLHDFIMIIRGGGGSTAEASGTIACELPLGSVALESKHKSI